MDKIWKEKENIIPCEEKGQTNIDIEYIIVNFCMTY